MISTRITVDPATNPLTEAEARQYARMGVDEEMLELGALLRGATSFVERETEMALITRTCEARLRCFPPLGLSISLAWPPLQSVTSIKYIDADGVEQTVDPATYTVDTHRFPGRVFLALDQNWPTDVRDVPDAVRIVYKAGFADTAEILATKSQARGHLDAVRLLLAQRDEVRNGIITGTIVAEVPFSLRSILRAEAIPDASETRLESIAA